VFQLAKLWRAFKDAFWALTLPIIILGGIFGGVVTATEGAALAVLAAIVHRHADLPRAGLAHLRDADHRGRRADRGR
jgi:C4-dicarboxylate transporter, DctM subunit